MSSRFLAFPPFSSRFVPFPSVFFCFLRVPPVFSTFLPPSLPPSLFLLPRNNNSQSQEWRRTCPKLRTKQTHLAKPLKRQSLLHVLWNIVEATARATVHAKNEPHRKRQDCSARRRINSVSPLAFALANCDRKICVSFVRPSASNFHRDHEARPSVQTNSG